MKLQNHILMALTAILTLASCATPKDVVYFQDVAHEGSTVAIQDPELIRIRPADKLSIIVSCQDERLTTLFNLTIPNRNGSSGSNRQDITLYNVDSDGCIDFPVLGKIKVAGMTREQVSQYIRSEITTKDLARDPVVTVNYGNQSVLVLGDIGKGRVDIDRDRMTILDVITDAGDLNLSGRRDRVWVYREEDGQHKTYRIDLCDAAQVHNSPAYYVQQNDIVYVEPNEMSIRSTTVNGNTLHTVSFWTSMVTFTISLAALAVSLF